MRQIDKDIATRSWMDNFSLLWPVVLLLLVVLPISDSWADEKKSADDEARQLRELVHQLQHRIENLERQQEKSPSITPNSETPVIARPPQSVSKKPKKTLPHDKVLLDLPEEGKVTFSFGGQIDIQATSSWPSNPPGDDIDVFASTIPTSSGGENGQFFASAKDSRLWFKTSAMTKLGIFKTLVEMDFKGSAGTERINNSHNPRMRHAYAELGSVAIGQTESTFANLVAWPDTTPEAIAHVSNRQAMIRWTQKLDEDFSLQIALENPETTLTDATGARIIPADDRVPDLAVKTLWYSERSSLALSGLLREIRSDGAVVGGVEDSEVGGGLYFSGKLKTNGNDNVRFGIAAGNAIGRYASSNSFNDGSIDANGQIELHMMYLGYLSYQYWFNDHWRIAATGTHIEVDNDPSRVPASSLKDAQSYHLRLSWLPLLRTIFSVEYIHARSELESGVDGELNRLHFNALYKF